MRAAAVVAVSLLGCGVASAALALVDREAVRQYFEREDRRLLIGAGIARAPLVWQLVAPAARRHGVPEATFFALAMAESQFNPHAVSPTGAEGMWQFTAETGREYGVPDRASRFDPQRSAESAARYLARLEKRFGHQDLALAAYNIGPTALAATLRRTGTRSWLAVRPHLRAETRDYVPKIEWLAEELYPAYLDGAASDAGVRIETASAGETLYAVARRYECSIEELRMLNRGELRVGTPIAVPPLRRVVLAGETLEQIALESSLSLEELRRANDLAVGRGAVPDQVLRIPVRSAASGSTPGASHE